MNIYDVAELQQYLNPQANQQSTQLVDPSMLLPQRSPSLGIQSQRLVDPLTLMPQIRGGIMTQAPLQNLGFDTSFGVANEEDVEQEFLPDQKKSGGLADLFRAILGFAIPGANFFLNKGRDALGGIRSLNQRLRNTDFARSRTGAEYFQRREARKDAERLQTVGQQLQQASERGGGYQPTTTAQNIARTESRVSGGKTRAYGL